MISLILFSEFRATGKWELPEQHLIVKPQHETDCSQHLSSVTAIIERNIHRLALFISA